MLMRRFLLSVRWLGLGLVTLAAHLTYAGGVLAVDNPARQDAVNGAYVQAQGFAANDLVPLQSLAGNWRDGYSPRSGDNIALLSARSEVGLEWQGVRLGLLRRAEAFMQTNRDTADLARQYQSQSGYDSGRNYAVDYRAVGFDADGFKVSKRLQTEWSGGWQLVSGAGVSYLRGRKIKLETWSGSATAISAQDFNATLKQDQASSDIDVSDLQAFNAPYGRIASPSGQGYAVDIGMLLNHAPSGVSMELAIADLAGQIDWINVPANASTLTTATKSYDANGYVQYDPAVTRASTYRNVSMMLDPKVHAEVSLPARAFLPASSLRFFVALDTLRNVNFWQTGLRFEVAPGWQMQTDMDLRFQTVGLSLTHRLMHFSLRTDQLDVTQAKALGFSVALKLPL